MNATTRIGRIVCILAGAAAVLGTVLVGVPAMAAEVQVQRLDDPSTNDSITVSSIKGYQVTPDKDRVVFLGDFRRDNFDDLYIAALDGATPPVLIASSSQGSIVWYSITPNSERAVYRDSMGKVGVTSIYGDETPTELEGIPANVMSLYSGNAGLVYLADDGIYEIAYDGSSGPVLLKDTTGETNRNIVRSSGHILYMAKSVDSGENSLYSIPVGIQNAAIRLFSSSVEGSSFGPITATPDGHFVIFWAGPAGGKSLYCVDPAEPTSLVLLHTPPQSVEDSSLRINVSADSMFVIFRAKEATAQASHLYSIPVNGSAGAFDFGVYENLQLTPTKVVFTKGAISRLYSAPIAGGVFPTLISDPDLASDVRAWQLSSDGNRIAYRTADNRLFMTSVAGGDSLAIWDGSGTPEYFGFTADGAKVIYIISRHNNSYSVFLIREDGSVENEMDLAFDAARVDTITRVSSDLFLCDGWQIAELYAFRPSDGAVFALNPTPLSKPKGIPIYDGTSDRKGVVFSELDDYDIYVVPVDASAPQRMVNKPSQYSWRFRVADIPGQILYTHFGIHHFQIKEDLSSDAQEFPFPFDNMTLDEQRVLVQESNNIGGTRLITALVATPEPVTIYDGKRAYFSFFTPDGNTVVILQDDGKVVTVPSDGGAPPVQISGEEVVTTVPNISMDNRWAGYQAGSSLYTAPLDRHVAPIVQADNVVVGRHAFSMDGQWLAFTARVFDPLKKAGDTYDLHAVPSNGSVAPILLAQDVQKFEISADCAQVAYTSNGQLYSARLDGMGYKAVLSGTELVKEFGLNPAGDWVVYWASVGDVDGLFASPLEGFIPPVSLTEGLPPTATVLSSGGGIPFKISPDGGWVSYCAYDAEVYTLYGVPLAGGPARWLSALGTQPDGPGIWVGDYAVYRDIMGGQLGGGLYSAVVAGAPEAAITRGAGQPAISNTLRIRFTVVFDVPVTGLEQEDFVNAGTARGIFFEMSPLAPNRYALSVGDASSNGTIIPRLPAGSVVNSAGEPNAEIVNPESVVTLALPGEVPYVIGMTQAEAAALLGAAGLTAGNVAQMHSATVPAGQVMQQDPAAGTLAAPGSSVDLMVSMGPEPVAVPPLAGLTQEGVAAALAAAGFVLGEVTPEYSATVPAGQVIRQEPAADAQVVPGAAIHIWISSGVEPAAVPNVVGMMRTTAEAAIVAAGFVVGDIIEEYSATVPVGQIIRQAPDADSAAAPGSAIDIWVSSGVQPVLVPHVVGMTQTAAAAALVEAGLALGDVTQVFSATVVAGVVISQSLGMGAIAPPGTAVALVVSKGVETTTGVLQVTITPEGAVDAGAQWRVDGGDWQDSGATVTGLAAGAHVVEFSDIEAEGAIGCVAEACTCYVTPDAMDVTVVAGETLTATGTYEQKGTADDAGVGAILMTILMLLFRSGKSAKAE